MFAVSVKRHVRKLGEFGATGIHSDFATGMPNPQLADAMRRSNVTTSVPNMPSVFSVSRFEKKAVPVVNKQYGKLSGDGYAIASQDSAHFQKDGFEVRRPRLSSNPDFAGGDLPDLADCGIDDGFVAAAVRRAFSLSDVHRDLQVWNAAVPPR